MPIFNARIMQEVMVGNSDKRTFCASFSTSPTAATELINLSSTGNGAAVIRLRQLVITNPGLQTAAGVVDLTIGFIGGPGSVGGAVVTPLIMSQYEPDSGILAAGVTIRSGDTNGGAFNGGTLTVPVFVPAAAASFVPVVIDFSGTNFKAMTNAPGSSTHKCISVRHPGTAGASGFKGYVVFTAEPALGA